MAALMRGRGELRLMGTGAVRAGEVATSDAVTLVEDVST
eukprot:CAMPEP_0182518282 /NCGR_PEP_ID=MMETSP1321-20130603/43974_1 /TAXON_ID=91990 /ORGANISM="Bolidomonas sp., Strain RCC1657" /LENGTH=38 /DNA_ID= /DNA_START= /DNA_END= /DNA_ORIENTATION=